MAAVIWFPSVYNYFSSSSFSPVFLFADPFIRSGDKMKKHHSKTGMISCSIHLVAIFNKQNTFGKKEKTPAPPFSNDGDPARRSGRLFISGRTHSAVLSQWLYLQVHCPEGQAQEEPQLQPQSPMMNAKRGKGGFWKV